MYGFITALKLVWFTVTNTQVYCRFEYDFDCIPTLVAGSGPLGGSCSEFDGIPQNFLKGCKWYDFCTFN